MGGECGEYYRFNETSESNTYSMIWSYYYTLCYWSNMIIANVPDNNVASEAVKGRVIAEARAVRATAMMQLVQLFGNPPLADHILDGSEGNTPAADSWAFIAKELSEAAEALPSKTSVDGQSARREPVACRMEHHQYANRGQGFPERQERIVSYSRGGYQQQPQSHAEPRMVNND